MFLYPWHPLMPAEVETFCGLADRVLARLDHA
jgi:hypothetical protein